MIKVELRGVQEAIKALQVLPERVRNRHMKIALDAAGGVLKRASEAQVSIRTGLLKRSMAVKTKVTNKAAYTVVGVKRGIRKAIVTSRKGTLRAINTNTIRTGVARFIASPSRYMHLVEGGTRAHTVSAKNKRILSGNGGVWGKRVTISAKPKPFLAIAAATSGYIAQTKAIGKLNAAVINEARAISNANRNLGK